MNINPFSKIKKMNNDILIIQQTMQGLNNEMKILASQPHKDLDKETLNRIADLEVKIAKLWDVLVKVDPMGRPKATPLAKKMYGQPR